MLIKPEIMSSLPTHLLQLEELNRGSNSPQ